MRFLIFLVLGTGCSARLSKTMSDHQFTALVPPVGAEMQPGTVLAMDPTQPGAASVACTASATVDGTATAADSSLADALRGKTFTLTDDDLDRAGLSESTRSSLRALRVTFTAPSVTGFDRATLAESLPETRSESCSDTITRSAGGAVLVVSALSGDVQLEARLSGNPSETERAAIEAEIARVFGAESKGSGQFAGRVGVWGIDGDATLPYAGIGGRKGLTEEMLNSEVLSVRTPEPEDED